MLREIHNAPRLLEVLEAAADGESRPVPLPLRRRRLDLLVFVPEGSTEIQTFELNRRAADLVQFLASPRSVTKLREFAEFLGGNPDSAVAFARQLLELGVLVGGADSQEPAPHAMTPPPPLEGAELESLAGC